MSDWISFISASRCCLSGFGAENASHNGSRLKKQPQRYPRGDHVLNFSRKRRDYLVLAQVSHNGDFSSPIEKLRAMRYGLPAGNPVIDIS